MFLTGTFLNSRSRAEQDDLAYLTHLFEEFFVFRRTLFAEVYGVEPGFHRF
jgi:hypothetical protein